MEKSIINTNKFLEETIDFFTLDQEEGLISLDCSTHFYWLIDKLFICRFLYDCIDKDIGSVPKFL